MPDVAGTAVPMRSDWREQWGGLLQHWSSLIRRPAYALGIVIMLTLAVSAVGTAFAFFYATEYAPLPYPAANRLAFVGGVLPKYHWGDLTSSPSVFVRISTAPGLALRSAGLLSNNTNTVAIDIAGVERVVTFQKLTPALFTTLALSPVLGHWPEQMPAGFPVSHQAVITNRFWHKAYQGRPDVLGRILNYQGEAYAIVAVLPTTARYLAAGVDVLLPMALPSPGSKTGENFNDQMVVRLPAGASGHELTLGLQSLTQEMLDQLPPKKRESAKGFHFIVTPFREGLLEESNITQVPWVLLSVALLLWLLATVNTANFALVRHRQRLHELAIRNTLGAGPLRLLGFLLVEQVPLFALVVGLSLVLAWKCIRVLQTSAFGSAMFPIHFNAPVVACMAVLALLACIVMSLGPVLQMRGSLLRSELGQGHRITLSKATRLVLRALGAAQVVLAMALLGSSLVLAMSLYAALHRPLGFDPQHRLVVSLSFPQGRDAGEALNEIVQDMQGVANVNKAGGALFHLYPFSSSRSDIYAQPPGAHSPTHMNFTLVSPGFFSVLGIPILQGKAFAAGQNGLQNAAIVGQAPCLALFPHAKSCLGKDLPQGPFTAHIQAMVGNVAWRTRPWANTAGTLYLTSNSGLLSTFHIAVHSATLILDGKNLSLPGVQGELKRRMLLTVPGAAVISMKPYPQVIQQQFAEQTLIAGILTFIAAVALALSAYGVWAVNGAIAQARMPEFALRAVLGAQPRQLVTLALKEAGWVLGLGLMPGVILGVIVARDLTAGSYRANLLMPWAFTGGAVLLASIVLFTAWLPVRKATRASLNVLRMI